MIRIGQEYTHVWGDNTALYCKVTGIENDRVRVEQQYSFWNHATCKWEENPTTHVSDWNIKDFGDEAFWHQTIPSQLKDMAQQKRTNN